jgi:hypothetical protein
VHPQPLQQSQQEVRAFIAEDAPPSRMGFVHEHHIPRKGGPDHFWDALGSDHQVARHDDDAVFLPGMRGPSHQASNILQALPIEEPDGERELFP